MKSYKDLVKPVKKDLRESYIQGDLFKVGDIVSADGKSAEIINLGTNYVTLVSEGKTFKKWINEVSVIKTPIKHPVSEDAFSFKGYTTKHFTDDHVAFFASIMEHKDQFAVLNVIQALDTLLGLSEDFNFDEANKHYSRAVKYFQKFDLDQTILEAFKDQLFEKALLENKIFVAEGIGYSCAAILKNIYSIESTTPNDIIAEAINILGKKQGYVVSEGWETLGSFVKLMKANNVCNTDNITTKTKTLMGV